MKLNAPKNLTFIVCACLIVIGLVASLTAIPYLSQYSNWVSFVGGGLLSLACLMKGL